MFGLIDYRFLCHQWIYDKNDDLIVKIRYYGEFKTFS